MKEKRWAFGFILTIIVILMSNNVYATEDVRYIYPRVLVTSYEIVDGTIASGEEFTIKVYLQNLNEHSTAYNVVTSMNSLNNNVVIVEGKSNTIYFDKIKAGETKEFSMKLKLLDIADSGLGVMSFISNCYNEQGFEYSVESRLTLTVDNKAQLEIPVVTVSENAVVGEKALVSVRYSNAGDSKLNNIKMNIEGKILEEQKVADLGDLGAVEQKNLDFYVTFTENGSQALDIMFEYQDKVGKSHSIGPYPYTINVYSDNVADEKEYIVDTEKIQLGEKEIYMLAAGGALLILLAVCIVIRIRGNERKRVRG